MPKFDATKSQNLKVIILIALGVYLSENIKNIYIISGFVTDGNM